MSTPKATAKQPENTADAKKIEGTDLKEVTVGGPETPAQEPATPEATPDQEKPQTSSQSDSAPAKQPEPELDEEEVVPTRYARKQDIRKFYRSGPYNWEQVAAHFNVEVDQVREILNGPDPAALKPLDAQTAEEIKK